MKRTLKKPVRRLVLNAAVADQVVTNQFQSHSLSLNFQKRLTRHETMEGRNYLVVPMVMMREGVLNGSQGPLYYPANELAKIPTIWDHKPIVVYHPTMNGVGISACSPTIIDSRKIGLIMNTRFDRKAGALKSEAWLEVDRVGKVDDRVLKNIEDGKMTEVSTGLFTDNESEEGEFAGKKYVGIARNYRPDHLAILPDQKGACSIEDGAGLLRNQDREARVQELMRELNELIGNEGPTTNKIVEEDGMFYACSEAGKKLSKGYGTKKEAEARLKQIEMFKHMKQNAKGTSNVGRPISNAKENHMDREQMIAALIQNNVFGEEDKEFLEGATDEQIAKLHQNAFPPKKKKKDAEDMEDEDEDEEMEPTKNQQQKPVRMLVSNVEVPVEPPTAEEYVNNAPAEIRDMLQHGLQAHQAERSRLVTEITANKANVFPKEALNAKSIVELQGIAALARSSKPVANAAHSTPAFSGQAPVANAAEPKSEEPLVAPTMNFEKK
jgi:hypothetical protein